MSVFENSLRMKCARVKVPDGEVLFCIWETRLRDYIEFAKSNGKTVDASWKAPEWDGQPVNCEPDDPVVMVSWNDANAFCKWLTEKEIAAGKLPNNAIYRLPT